MGSVIDFVEVGHQLAVEQQGGVVGLAVFLQVGMAYSAVLAVPGFLLLREGEVGVVDSVCTQSVGAPISSNKLAIISSSRLYDGYAAV